MITILYCCSGCGLKDVEIAVAQRAPDKDVVHWMRHVVMTKVTADHAGKQPMCPQPTFDLKIPIDADRPVGTAGVH